MATDKPDSTAQSFSEMVTQWERNFESFANQVMGTEAYSQAMNNMQKTQLGFQRMFAQTMTTQLAAMNIPSREDVLQLTELVRQMDRRMERIEEKLGVSGSANHERKRPPRTKQPPVQADAESGAKAS
ncbi:MAG: hypothetical protein O3A63_10795 [Proteobacteria bacterium]|nr:hypothetical protein [Pseudomonadota bacterium]